MQREVCGAKKDRDTYVLKNGLHQRDCNFGLLNEVVFGVLDFKTGVLLLRWACTFQAITGSGYSTIEGKCQGLTFVSQHPTPTG